jgi:hypothetical protein
VWVRLRARCCCWLLGLLVTAGHNSWCKRPLALVETPWRGELHTAAAKMMRAAALLPPSLLLLLLLLSAGVVVPRPASAASASSPSPRRSSRLTPAFKGWLTSKGYLGAASGGITISAEGRLIATAARQPGEAVVRLPRHLVLSWLTVDPRRDATSVLGRAITQHPELFPSRMILPTWLCYERHRASSLFAPYLVSLPSKLDLPLMWVRGMCGGVAAILQAQRQTTLAVALAMSCHVMYACMCVCTGGVGGYRTRMSSVP